MLVYEEKPNTIIGKNILLGHNVKMTPYKTIDINNQTTTSILGIPVAYKEKVENYVELS